MIKQRTWTYRNQYHKMISHKHKCIFVHIPKAAGMSVEHVFLKLEGLTWDNRTQLLLRPNNDPKLGPPRLAHLKGEEYVKNGYISQKDFDSYFKFSFVRNPWERLVSEYKYRRYPKEFDFKSFLFKFFPGKSWTDQYIHVLPQYSFLYDKNGKKLVDYIGRFENIQNDFNEVCNQINIEPLPLPHVNKSLHGKEPHRLKKVIKKQIHHWRYGRQIRKNTFQHYRDYYDDESCEFVTKLYGQDIETFGYTF